MPSYVHISGVFSSKNQANAPGARKLPPINCKFWKVLISCSSRVVRRSWPEKLQIQLGLWCQPATFVPLESVQSMLEMAKVLRLLDPLQKCGSNEVNETQWLQHDPSPIQLGHAWCSFISTSHSTKQKLWCPAEFKRLTFANSWGQTFARDDFETTMSILCTIP